MRVVQSHSSSDFPIAVAEIGRTLRAIEGQDALFGDVFCERRESVTVEVEGGQLRSLAATRESGVAARRIERSRVAFACREGLTAESLADVAGDLGGSMELTARPTRSGRESRTGPPAVEELVGRALELDEAVRAAVAGTTSISIHCQRGSQLVGICNSVGYRVSEHREWGRIKVTLKVAARDRAASVAARFALPPRQMPLPSSVIAGILRRTDAALDVTPIAAGSYPVILPPGTGAVFFHETCGHPLEGGTGGPFEHSLGRPVGSPLLTLIDDGTLPGRTGSLLFDDEGFPSTRHVMIEQGRLRAFLADRLTSIRRQLRRPPQGNGRRESFRHPPLPRMTNLVVQPGPHGLLDDIVRETNAGYLAGELDRGHVDLESGTFSFEAPYGYLVARGKIERPVGAVLMHGRILDALSAIDRVGADVEFDEGSAYCLKGGQAVRVGLGQPTVRLTALQLTPI